MTERASIFQTVQIGVEATPGTAVAADKKLQSLTIGPAVKVETNKYRASGYKFPSLVVPGKEFVTAKLGGVITYSELIYPLASVLAYAAPVQQGATSAYLWTFAPDTDAADTVKTFTVEQGSTERAHRFPHGLVTGLELMFSRSGCEISGGEMIGAALEDNVAMTVAPTAIELVPVIPTQVDVYLADTQAGLAGATALARAISAGWKVNDRFGPVFPLATQFGTGFATTVEIEPAGQCSLKMEADAEGMALLSTLRQGATKFMRIAATGGLIEGTEYYSLQIDTALKVEDVAEFSDEDGLFAIEWTFSWVHDATWGKATEVQVENIQTDL
jgi:hypothetical protein